EQHVRRAGEDLRAGARVLLAGARIRPAEIAMLATIGRASVAVVRRPRVAVFSTGDELADIVQGELPPPGKIRDSNRYTLAALARDCGAEVVSIDRLPDDLEVTTTALRAAVASEPPPDVILTAGGVSVGDRDFVKPAVERLGRLMLWRVAVKPGKPLAVGRVGRALLIGLPGNPISAMVTFELFARPALLKMAGASGADLRRWSVEARLTDPVTHMPGRTELVRARTVWNERGPEGPGVFEATPAGAQGSGMLQSAVRANSLLVIPDAQGDVAAGEIVRVILTE
ncbi:MAG TPA: molybdopterin molybdotransferase MoeA, partial [Chthonomonadaceae bacterium]|nr:molybdopterin molybdotransferase MoeA [Chthonomonadaceae bacterium]